MKKNFTHVFKGFTDEFEKIAKTKTAIANCSNPVVKEEKIEDNKGKFLDNNKKPKEVAL